MKQYFHIKRDNQIHNILKWLEELPAEQKNGVPIHHIQSLEAGEYSLSLHGHIRYWICGDCPLSAYRLSVKSG